MDTPTLKGVDLQAGIEAGYIRTRSGKLFLPDFSRTPDVIGRYLRRKMAGRGRKVVFLFDSISYSKFKAHFGKVINTSNLKLYNSNFPPNTYNVYPSIFFGVPILKHNIPGTAFYTKKGLLNLVPDIVYRLDGTKAKNTDEMWNSRMVSFPTYSKRGFRAVLPNKQWLKTDFWGKMFYPALPTFVGRVGSEGDYRYDLEFSSLLERVSQTLKKTHSDVMAYLDFDEVMHLFGVEKRSTHRLIQLVADAISEIINNNAGNDYFFVSDHGHIDQKSVEKADFGPILKSFYCMNGGAGRTRYFYTKDPMAFEYIKDLVGNTGVVLRRGDKVLNMLYGFDTGASDRIGDIVAIATKPNFPSHGWKYAGEHGGATLEEYNVPFLHLAPSSKEASNC